jgi:hypothetical protein
MKSFLLNIGCAATVVAAAAFATDVHVPDTKSPSNGDEFETDHGSVVFETMTFKPDGTNPTNEFDATVWFDVIALQPDSNRLSGQTEVKYRTDALSTNPASSKNAQVELVHGVAYASRESSTNNFNPQEGEQQNQTSEVDFEILIGPHWPIIVIRDIGAGAEGTDFMVIRRDHPTDPTKEVISILMMEGEDTSKVWIKKISGTYDGYGGVNKSLAGTFMDDWYMRVITPKTGSINLADIEFRPLKETPVLPMDELDENAAGIRAQILKRREDNKDKFWNPGEEDY